MEGRGTEVQCFTLQFDFPVLIFKKVELYHYFNVWLSD